MMRLLSCLLSLGILLTGTVPCASAAPQGNGAKPQASALSVGRITERQSGSLSTVCFLMSEQMVGSPSEADLQGFIDLSLAKNGNPVPAEATLSDKQLCLSSLSPGEEYSVTLRKGLKSASGHALAQDYAHKFKTSDAAPSLTMDKGTVLPMSMSEGSLEVRTVNIKSLNAFLYRIPRESLPFISNTIQNYVNNIEYPWVIQEMMRSQARLLGKHTYTVDAQPNASITTKVSLSDFAADISQGVYFVIVTNGGHPFDGTDPENLDSDDSNNQHLARMLFLTDLGLTAYNGYDSIKVMVRSLKDAAPRSGVTVKLVSRNGETIGTAETDSDGLAGFGPEVIKADQGGKPTVVIAEDGSDFCPLDLRYSELFLDKLDARDTEPNILHAEVFAYTERGIYRPGETVHYTALVRNQDLSASTQESLLVDIKRPDGVIYATHTVLNKGAGMFQTDFDVPKTDSIGHWSFDLRLDKENLLSSKSVNVQHFTPQNLSVEFLTAENSYITQQNPVKVQSNFNYGAPAADLQTEASVALNIDNHPFPDDPKLKDFYFGPAEDQAYELNTHQYLSDMTLDEEGCAVYQPVIKKVPFARSMEVNARVLDIDGNAVTASRTFKVRSFSPMVGIRRNAAENRYTFVYVDPDGARQTAEISYKLYLRRYDYQYTYDDGRWRSVRTEHRQLISSGRVKTGGIGNLGAEIELSNLRHGSYLLEAETGGSKTALTFYEGYAPSTDVNTPDRVELALNQESYTVGQEAKLEFDSLISGYADLALGSDSIVEIRHLKVDKGHNSVSVPITENFNQGMYALLSVYAPLDSAGAVIRTVGLTHIKVTRPDRIMTVKVSGPDSVRPDSDIEIPVEFTGAEGDIFYTAALVDEGILQLTNFKSPQPEEELFKPRYLRLELNDMYSLLLRQYTAEGEGYGGEDEDSLAKMGMNALETLKTRPLVAMYEGVVKAADGKANLKFHLPTLQGGVRLMVVAASADAMGSASAGITVHDKAVLQPSFPQIVHVGDVLRGALSVHNLEIPDGKFALKVDCGSEISCSAPEAAQQVKQGSRAMIPLKIRALKAGNAKVHISLSGTDFSTEQNLELKVAPALPVNHAQDVYALKGSESKTVKAPGAFLPGALYQVTYSSLPYTDAAAFKKDLLEEGYYYSPYRLIYPILALTAIPDSSDLAITQTENAKLQDLVTSLEIKVNESGYVSSPEQGGSYDYYATALTYQALLAARDSGYSVNPEILHLLDNATKNIARDAEPNTATAAAMEAQSLSGAQNLASLRYLFDEHRPKSALGLSSLARSLYANGDEERATLALKLAIEAQQTLAEARASLGTVAKADDRVKILQYISSIESVSISSTPFELCDLIQTMMATGMTSRLGDVAAALSATPDLRWNVPLACKASLLIAQKDSAGKARSTAPDTIKQSGIPLKNPSANALFATVDYLGFLKSLPANPKDVSFKASLYMTDGTQMRPPYKVKQNEQFIVLYTLTREIPSDGEMTIRIPLAAGMRIDTEIGQKTRMDYFGKLVPLQDKHDTGDGILGVLDSPYGSKTQQVALLVRAGCEGKVVLPPVVLEVPQSSVMLYTKPVDIEVTAPGQ